MLMKIMLLYGLMFVVSCFMRPLEHLWILNEVPKQATRSREQARRREEENEDWVKPLLVARPCAAFPRETVHYLGYTIRLHYTLLVHAIVHAANPSPAHQTSKNGILLSISWGKVVNAYISFSVAYVRPEGLYKKYLSTFTKQLGKTCVWREDEEIRALCEGISSFYF